MNFLFRKLVESKLKDVPPQQREMIFSVLEKNPEFFERIAKEVKELQDGGKDQQAAVMEVMQRHQAELARIMNESKNQSS
ncbi:MAG: hypothetical protein A2653_02750 [Candidatus Zambryskibacteria bacterium RIFCSPHIGHO2_01_FULL_43_25]|uniref:Uncharacterized protein n=1 Tax=Candidatus Zambryskibacteria bacterium RIFCSPLOWO2_01_FULL_45_21 TaxID=1802761 RepID=A0A1G2U0J5_9BACT|nr:MAG: hypothetical protein A2653_02750 [Candidatus Zambryskibacteria bacterium RIFCSPHIGHO2_01_FULL_43_25]OHB00541.1 MAG: hypothetical protein A3E94_01960 [Candidatus Zambryskibacteria bacterium RIFCSPHIGHO2_12_FULL_44_12b]OHB03045.1 MAG: hypothetical protein A3B14_00055 [Candidatus Zambryskibacteria bacterium RIFCSPLOWO2_01_FULL_45_21]